MASASAHVEEMGLVNFRRTGPSPSNRATVMQSFIVDAFTDVAFKGNPAGVCIVERPLSDARMLQIAQELNLSRNRVRSTDPATGLFFDPLLLAEKGDSALRPCHTRIGQGAVRVASTPKCEFREYPENHTRRERL